MCPLQHYITNLSNVQFMWIVHRPHCQASKGFSVTSIVLTSEHFCLLTTYVKISALYTFAVTAVNLHACKSLNLNLILFVLSVTNQC